MTPTDRNKYGFGTPAFNDIFNLPSQETKIISLRSETPPALRVSATSNVKSLKYNIKCKIVAAIASEAEVEA